MNYWILFIVLIILIVLVALLYKYKLGGGFNPIYEPFIKYLLEHDYVKTECDNIMCHREDLDLFNKYLTQHNTSILCYDAQDSIHPINNITDINNIFRSIVLSSSYYNFVDITSKNISDDEIKNICMRYIHINDYIKQLCLSMFKTPNVKLVEVSKNNNDFSLQFIYKNQTLFLIIYDNNNSVLINKYLCDIWNSTLQTDINTKIDISMLYDTLSANFGIFHFNESKIAVREPQQEITDVPIDQDFDPLS